MDFKCVTHWHEEYDYCTERVQRFFQVPISVRGNDFTLTLTAGDLNFYRGDLPIHATFASWAYDLQLGFEFDGNIVTVFTL